MGLELSRLGQQEVGCHVPFRYKKVGQEKPADSKRGSSQEIFQRLRTQNRNNRNIAAGSANLCGIRRLNKILNGGQFEGVSRYVIQLGTSSNLIVNV